MLLLFNDTDEMTYGAIKEQLGASDEKELQRTMLSLSVGKVCDLQPAGSMCGSRLGHCC